MGIIYTIIIIGMKWWVWIVIALYKGTRQEPKPMVCQFDRGAKLFELPKEMNCNNTNTRKVRVTISKKNLKQYEVEARSLTIIDRGCTATYNFFGAKTKNKWEKRTALNKETAQKYLHNKHCGNTDKTIRKQPLTMPYKCEFSWPQSKTHVTRSCYFKEGKIVAEHNGFLFSALGDISHCKYMSGWCQTAAGIHIKWTPNNKIKEPYLFMGIHNATILGKHLIIPTYGMAFNLKSMNKSDEGGNKVYRSHSFEVRILREAVKSKNNISYEETSLGEKFRALQEEVSGKLQFIYDKLQAPTHQIQWLCQALQEINRVSNAMASANPTLYIREILKHKKVVARKAGAYIMVWPCGNVFEYKWAKLAECYKGIPIHYKLHKHSEYRLGFLDVETMEVHKNSIEISCDKHLTESVMVHDKLWIHKSKHGATEVNTEGAIALPGVKLTNASELYNLPNNWIFNITDFMESLVLSPCKVL